MGLLQGFSSLPTAVVLLRQALPPMTLFYYRGDTPDTNQTAEIRIGDIVRVNSNAMPVFNHEPAVHINIAHRPFGVYV